MKLFMNLNENIKVKINDEGYQYMADKHNEIMKEWTHLKSHSAEHYKMKADKDGYTKMQFWNFIEEFGPITHIGFQLYYDPNILIETNF